MSDEIAYDHTQKGTFLRIWLGALVAVFATIAITSFVNGQREDGALLLGVTALSSFIALMFHCLTVQVTSDSLRWSFGIGVIKKTILLDSIEAVSIVKTRWYHGWGIKRYSGGWLYNVDGFDAVQINLRDGKQCRLGTDEPQALHDAIKRACRLP